MSERVLITGGGSGIGAAIAKRCEKDGFEVVTIDVKGGDIAANLMDATMTRDAIDQALEGGPITRLVNNVGMIDVASIEDVELEELDRAVKLNIQASILCAQKLIPAMKQNCFGRIVNIASRAALGKEGRTTYSATKAGVLGMTRSWALELGEFGITVNSIGPGPIRTDMFDAANPPGAPETNRIIESIPVRRMGKPEDIAHSVSHLLDTRTSFITGQTLYICGGKTVGLAAI